MIKSRTKFCFATKQRFSKRIIPTHSIDEAMEKAKELLHGEKPKIVAIPDGISVIVKKM